MSSFSLCTVGLLLGLYWTLPWFIVSGLGIQEISALRTFICIFTFGTGICLMIASDAQKNFTLKFKKGLINDGMFRYTRNPNYLGEILIYLSFAICTGYWASYAILITVWVVLFGTFMVKKEKSLKQKQGWDEYSKSS